MSVLLILKGVMVSYGLSQVFFDVVMFVEEGQVVVLMGCNGMGKFMMVKVVCGMLLFGGEIWFDGVDLLCLLSYKIVWFGIGLVLEGWCCFVSLSVEENLIVVVWLGKWMFQEVVKMFFCFVECWYQWVVLFFGGEQQMLVIGWVLMINLRLVILDEVIEGLVLIICQEIWVVIDYLKVISGFVIFLVDKLLKEFYWVVDNGVILECGWMVWFGLMFFLDVEIGEKYFGVQFWNIRKK